MKKIITRALQGIHKALATKLDMEEMYEAVNCGNSEYVENALPLFDFENDDELYHYDRWLDIAVRNNDPKLFNELIKHDSLYLHGKHDGERIEYLINKPSRQKLIWDAFAAGYNEILIALLTRKSTLVQLCFDKREFVTRVINLRQVRDKTYILYLLKELLSEIDFESKTNYLKKNVLEEIILEIEEIWDEYHKIGKFQKNLETEIRPIKIIKKGGNAKLFKVVKKINEHKSEVEGCFYRNRDLQTAIQELETVLLKMNDSQEGRAFNDTQGFDGTNPYEFLTDLKTSLEDMRNLLAENDRWK